jgi:hypothetical protein
LLPGTSDALAKYRDVALAFRLACGVEQRSIAVPQLVERDVIPALSSAAVELTTHLVEDVRQKADLGIDLEIPAQAAALGVVNDVGHELARDQRVARDPSACLDDSMHLRHERSIRKRRDQCFPDLVEIGVNPRRR